MSTTIIRHRRGGAGYREDFDTGFDPTMLRLLREEEGWSQKHLAGLVGATPTIYSLWENGRSRPSRGRLVALADALGVSVASLCVD